ALLVILGAIFFYSAYLELGTDSVPDAAVNSFIQKDADLEIHFIDVGQGDCSLIMWEGASMLIDCGEREQAETVLKYLKKQGVKKLDYIIATHPHSDHIGGMGDIISEIEVDKVIAPRVSDSMTPTTKTYERFLQALKDKSLKLTAAKPDTTYTLSSTAASAAEKIPPKFEVLAPVNDYNDLNNYSVVIRLTYGTTAYLFTGDAEKEAELDILENGAEVDSDVLKVGHHGSSTSSCNDFYEAVSPDICVIQCGNGNSYGHPHKETIDTINSSGAKVFRNDTDGTVIVYSDGNEIFVKTEKDSSEKNGKNTEKEDEN
ncbi:MAG: MBL fold metallo-hydrolase, partial [Oscillospiraceae bacterium]|nr:MBL fold metallo-hydrolase [Oscillospiraceae bacterium]